MRPFGIEYYIMKLTLFSLIIQYGLEIREAVDLISILSVGLIITYLVLRFTHDSVLLMVRIAVCRSIDT